MKQDIDTFLKVLMIDAGTSFYRINRYKLGDFWGPVDMGLHLAGRYNSLNIGVGLLAGSIFPGSNRLIVNGFSPCWGGFFVSSMGGAGLVFDNLGINMLSVLGKAPSPSILYLNRDHGEEIEISLAPIDLWKVWDSGRKGTYGMMEYAYQLFGENYSNAPRILATGPASATTDFGAIGSAPIKKGTISNVDTWAGRGGFGSKMLQEHNIAGIIYGGTYVDEDFRDRKVADVWFQNKYQKKMAAKDIEATTKYRFDPNFETGGTFGVNYATLGGRVLAFNYNSINWPEEKRLEMHQNLIVNHYLKQFNEETIANKQQFNCGEPCVAVCKKMNDHFKKDYEPYQTMGPLSGIFDQRAAEELNHHADMLGFDAISVGGVISWFMECLDKKLLLPEDLGVSKLPLFDLENFQVVEDSKHNSELAIEILDSIIYKKGLVDLKEGARKFGRRLSRKKGVNLLDHFVFISFGRKGWMVPNQYWTPGVLSPMPIMGKYYMNYGNEFLPPRTLGHQNALRFNKELILDNLGFCRFHRNWAEEMMPEVMGELFSLEEKFLTNISQTASRINSRNASVFWESKRNFEVVHSFLKRQKEVLGATGKELEHWINYFEKDQQSAAIDYWYEMHKGTHESLREF
jgi:glyceraldehyde-3-phosphate dehydrogenase (ferredoxin)